MKFRLFTLRSLAAGILFVLLTLNLPVAAQQFSYPDSWGSTGLTLRGQSTTGVQLNFSISDFAMSNRVINGESMQELSVEGNFLPNDAGAPNLPSFSRIIAVPQGATAQVEILNMRKESFSKVEMAPAPRIPLETERGPLQYNRNLSIYSKNACYPAQPVTVSQVTKIRGVDIVYLSVTPFQYNPVTKELVVLRDIEINVNFTGGNGQFGEERLRSRYWDPILMDNIFNSQSLPKINYASRYAGRDNSNATNGCEYLIIVPNDPVFSSWADSIKAFRTEQGILTEIVTLQEIGGSTTGAIENYINNAYNTWTIPPSAILIMADYGSSAQNSITSPIWDSYCVSDNIYADVDNNDLPDIALARMTANNNEQLSVMVTKFLSYERNPPTSASFYDHPITALGWQTERWFQICSEVVGGFLKNKLGKDPVRINAVYQGNPNSDPWSTATNTTTVVNYFGPNGLNYIPATPQELGGFSGGTPQQVSAQLNEGSFMLQHRDHGFESGWGEPAYTSSHISNLTNVGKLSFIFSVNCLTGKYNWTSECFAEKFHRYTYNGQNAGALGLLAASEVSYSFVNDAFVWGLYDNLWPEFMPSYGAMFQERGLLPAFGMAAGKIFLAQSAWPYNTSNKTVTYHLFHHHGDAFLTMYSEVPQQLSVNHAQVMMNNASTFYVTATAGSFIALTANGEIIGTAEGTGSPVAVPVNPPAIGTVVKVVVTKTNYYRHYSSVLVISPNTAYVITDDHTVSDPTGNNNQHLDFGETGQLSLTEKNLGNYNSDNTSVSISLNDPYITLTDATENYGTIPGNQSVTVQEGFGVQVAGNVPNQHTAMVTAQATNGTDTWTSYFYLNCWAPALSVGAMQIDDTQGGDGNHRLDPGETAIVRIYNPNNGNSAAPGAVATLSVTSGMITLNSSTFDLGTINPLSSPAAVFTVSVHPSAPVGLNVGFNYSVESGAYSAQQTFNVQVGLIVEDWETGDFNKFAWTPGGNKPWELVTSGTYEGVYSAKSGSITNNQSSIIALQYSVPQDDTIKFQYKLSSELNKDYMKFYIDNVPRSAYSGTVAWTQAKFPISAGSHSFKWVYSKDGAGTGGADAAWIDFIVLPAPLVTTAFAGTDGYTCSSSSYQCSGDAANYTTVSWSTMGTGTFSNATILNPVYTPGAADIAAGSVNLVISVTGVTGTATDTVLLTIHEPPVAIAGADAAICEGNGATLSGATASNYTTLAWTTSGTGIFDDAGLLHPVYTPSAADAQVGLVVLTLNASNPGCTPATSTTQLTIHALPPSQVTGTGELCQNQVATYSTPSTQGNSYNWTVEGGNIVSGAGTAEIQVEWTSAAAGHVTVTENNAFCSNTSSIPVTVNTAPQPLIDGAAILCTGTTQVYSTPLVSGHSYSWNWGGAFVSGQDTHEATINWAEAGSYTLSLTETNDQTLCATTVNMPVVVNALPGNPSKPQGADKVDLYKEGSSAYTSSGTYADTYTWELLPADAGIIAGNTGSATVSWNSSFRGTATIRVKGSNNCGEGNWSETIEVTVINSLGIGEDNPSIGLSVTPNPNEGKFRLSVNTGYSCRFDIMIFNAGGSLVYERNTVESKGRWMENMDLDLVPGSYNLIIKSEVGTSSGKFVVK